MMQGSSMRPKASAANTTSPAPRKSARRTGMTAGMDTARGTASHLPDERERVEAEHPAAMSRDFRAGLDSEVRYGPYPLFDAGGDFAPRQMRSEAAVRPIR